MTTTNTGHVHHGDLVTLTDDEHSTTTYRFIDQYQPVNSDRADQTKPCDPYEILTAGSAIGQRLIEAKVGDTITITHLNHTFTVHFIAHQPA